MDLCSTKCEFVLLSPMLVADIDKFDEQKTSPELLPS
jgi:hypothetical protein